MGTDKEKIISELKKKDNINKGDQSEKDSPSSIGWHSIEKKDISFQGRLYPESWEFQIRPATVKEVRHWSGMDQTNVFNVLDTLNQLIDSNVRILEKTENGGKRIINSNQIYEHDRFTFILFVHTYTGNSKKMKAKHRCQHCDHPNEIEINPFTLSPEPLSEFAEKYVDSKKGGFTVKTKNFGDIHFKPTSIQEANKLKNYMAECHRENLPYEHIFSHIFKFLITDNRESIKDLYQKYLGLDKQKFDLYNYINNQIGMVKPIEHVEGACEKCQEPFRQKIEITEGLRDIFTDTRISGEFI